MGQIGPKTDQNPSKITQNKAFLGAPIWSLVSQQALIAQLVRRWTRVRGVPGSNPARSKCNFAIMSWNIVFFDQKKGVYERDFALPSLRIPLRVPKLYLGWYWSWNCDVQSSSCARVRTRAPSYQMERSQCMLSYNSTCRFNTGGDRNAACTIQGAGGRRVVFSIYIWEWVPLGEYGRIIHQNAGNREPVDLVQ